MDTLRRFERRLRRDYPNTRRLAPLAAAFLTLAAAMFAYGLARRWSAGLPLWAPRSVRLLLPGLVAPLGLVATAVLGDWINRRTLARRGATPPGRAGDAGAADPAT